MAKNDFKLVLTKDSELRLKLLAKSGKADLRPTMKVIGTGYRKEVKAIFNRQQPRQAGNRWDKLSEPYGSIKASKYPSKGILQRTGSLIRSITQKGASGNITIIGKTFGIFGTSVDYAKYHDDGTSKMPRRNFSEPSKRRFDIWKNQISRDISRNFEKNGIKVDKDIFQ